MRKTELLAPAKNFETGIAAINCGADALYIGPERFGARAAAGNSIADISRLLTYSHRYSARVYAAVNTILYEHELEEAPRLIVDLYNAGIDGIIFQDMGILEMDLPPVPLHASTQCDNYDIEKIKFLDSIGIPRIVLARELSSDDLRRIRGEVGCELEYFIHGALCVSMSGRCYMSAASGGRSANRGECAQPCRKSYTLKDSRGRVIPAGRYPLSLKDLNRTAHIGELIEAGIDSFKIEGRLKDINYVKNTVAHYRRAIDACLEGRTGFCRSSSGISLHGFIPDPERTFNRGYTAYFSSGRSEKLLSSRTPKSTGKRIGTVTEIEGNRFRTDSSEEISNGDGLFFFGRQGGECGLRVNRVHNGYIYPLSMEGIYKGAELFRNHDAAFEKVLDSAPCERKIPVDIIFSESDTGYLLIMTDPRGFSAEVSEECEKEVSINGIDTVNRVEKQITRLGGTIFSRGRVEVRLSENRFIPVSLLNDMRRRCSEKLENEIIRGYIQPEFHFEKTEIRYPFEVIDYSWNVSNSLAEKFYLRHGVKSIAPSFETSARRGDEALMTTKMCLKYENGLCPGYGGRTGGFEEPFTLNDGVRSYTVAFDCAQCFMIIRSSD